MALPTIDTADTPAILADQIIVTEQQKSANLARNLYTAPVNIPLAFVDTTVTSLANLTDWTGLTDFNLSDGVVPAGFASYHTNKEAWQATSDIASLFLIAGASTRAIQAGSKLNQLASSTSIPSKYTQLAFANRAKAAQIQTEYAAQAARTSDELASFGLQAQGVTDIAVPWQSLGGAVRTAEEVRDIGLRISRNASIKETVASEVAIAALMNDSEFLFGDDMSLMDYLLTAGMAGGVVAGIDRAIAAVGYRRALVQASQYSSAKVAQVRKGEVTFEQATTRPNSMWTTLSAASNEANRADAMLDAINSGAVSKGNAEVLSTAGVRTRQEALITMSDTTKAMFTNSPVSGVTDYVQKAAVPQDSVDHVISWIRKDQKNAVGVMSFESADVLNKMEQAVDEAHRAAARASADDNAKALDAAQGRLSSLNSVNVGVVEADGSVNISRTRKTPWQEQHPIGHTKLKHERRGFALSDLNAPKVYISNTGHVFKQVGSSNNVVLDLSSLDFDEITALYKTVAVGSSDKAFRAVFTGDAVDLPYPVLDALSSNKLKPLAADELSAQITSGEAAKQSLLQKYSAFVHNYAAETPHDLSKRLNLSMHTSTGEQSALMESFVMLRESGLQDISDYFVNSSFGDVIDALAGLHRKENGIDPRQVAEEMRSLVTGGSSLDLHNAVTPVGFVRAQANGASDTDMNFAKIAEASRMTMLNQLATSKNPFVSEMLLTMQNMHNVVGAASDIGSLTRDGLIESRGISAAAARAVTQTTNRFRDVAAIQHAHTLGQAFKRASEKYIDTVVKPVAEAHNALIRGNRYDVLGQHSDYSALIRIGGELSAPLLEKGLNALDKRSSRVAAMTKSVFGKSPDELAGGKPLYLFDKAAALRGEYKPIEFTDEGAAFINQMIEASYAQLDLSNELSRIMGRPETRKVYGHVPVADFSRLELRYIADESGRTVGYVSGKTAGEAEALQSQAIAYIREHKGEHLMPASDTHVKQWVESRNQQQFGQLINYGDPMNQTGIHKGRNLDVTRDVSGDVGAAQLISLRDSFDSMRVKAVYAMFEPLIIKNRQLARVGNASSLGQTQTKAASRSFFNANEEWENVLFANSARPEGALAYRLEDTMTAWLEDVYDQAARKLITSRNTSSKLSKQQQAAIDKIVDGYDPMGAAAEAIARTKVVASPDDRRIAAALQTANKVTGEVFLKFMNLAHPILNLMSVAVTTPAVAQQLVRRSGETLESWHKRAGPWAEFIDGDSTATTSATKLLANGVSFFHSDAGREALTQAKGYGMITANMLEELNSAIFKTPSKAADVAGYVRKYGDLINVPINAVATRMGKQLSSDTISERSETYVRGLMHAVGYHFISKHARKGMTDLEKHSFAFWFANQNIADYAPNIRGQAFRGVSGIPLGLFQSFGINFLQRVFNYVENKDTRALAVQAATQTAIFGAEGLPGWPAVNSYFAHAHDKGGDADSTFTDRMYGAYGKQMSDVLLTGTVSNLPRLFGAADGVNFYTAGDTNPRVLGFMPPALSLAAQSRQLVQEAIASEVENLKRVSVGGEYDSTRTAEIVAAYMPNRGVRSLLELGLGYSADRAGDLVRADTRSGVALLSRVLGTKTVDEVRQRQAAWHNTVDLQHRRARLSQIGRAFTAAIRAEADSLGVTPDDVQVSRDMFDAYLARWVAEGGRLDTAGDAFNRMIDKAYTPETVRNVRDYVSTSGTLKGGDIYQFALERLLHYGFDNALD